MKRVLLIGCGGLLVLAVLIGAAAIVFGPKLAHKGVTMFQDLMTENARLQAIEGSWNPPEHDLPAAWVPARVDAWTATGPAMPFSGLPQLKIDRPGTGGGYELSGERMEVSILPANDLEWSALQDRAVTALTSGSGTHTTGNLSHRTTLRVNGTDQTCFWWLKSWFFIFRTNGKNDPAVFAEAYLKAVDSTPAPAAATPEPLPAGR